MFDGVEYDGVEVLESLGARDGKCAYRVRVKKLILTATELGHVQLIDLVDAFVGERAMFRLMIALRSAYRAASCLGRKSASTATAEAPAAQEAASGSRSRDLLLETPSRSWHHSAADERPPPRWSHRHPVPPRWTSRE